MDKPFSNHLSRHVTLKMGSRSPESNQFFYMTQQSRYAGMVEIHIFLQEIGCKQALSSLFQVLVWPWKWGQGPQNLINIFPHLIINVGHANVHLFFKKIECRQDATPTLTPTPTGSTLKTISPRPLWWRTQLEMSGENRKPYILKLDVFRTCANLRSDC